MFSLPSIRLRISDPPNPTLGVSYLMALEQWIVVLLYQFMNHRVIQILTPCENDILSLEYNPGIRIYDFDEPVYMNPEN